MQYFTSLHSKVDKWISMKCIYFMHFHSLKTPRAMKRTLTASVSCTRSSISTSIRTLVVPGVLSGSPRKTMLKIVISEKHLAQIDFAKI